MTKGSTIAIQYSDTVYQFNVTDVKPADAVSIIEADVEVRASVGVQPGVHVNIV